MYPSVSPIPSEPEVLRLARQFREAINADLDAQVYEMAERWVRMENNLSGIIDAMVYEIDEAVRLGELVSQSSIRQLARYKELRDQIYQEIRSYNVVAESMIIDKQRVYGGLGIENAANLIRSSYEGQISAFFNVLPVDAIETLVGYLGDGTPLNQVLQESFPGSWQRVTDALFDGFTLGLGPREVAQNMVDGLGYGLNKATVIARTEQLRAYRQSSVMQYRESKVVRGFKRMANQAKACMACLMADGEFFEVREDFTDHPNGGCVAVPVVIGVSERKWTSGEDYFNSLSPEEQKARMGAKYYQAWQDGQFKLSDLHSVSHSDVWGDMPQVKALKDLTNE
jgi:hypothetical protein